jgi:tetratricopeptide (TPR) repeat protein
MVPLRLRVAPVALLSLALPFAACKDPAPAPPPPSAPPAEAKLADPAELGALVVDTKAPEPVPTEAGEHWLVWFGQDDQWVTRWIHATDAKTTLVAERHALVLSDDTRLWVVERKDEEVDVIPCECAEGDTPAPDCKPASRMVVPGLQATELRSGDVVAVRAASKEPLIGGDLSFSLDVQGGVGSRLVYAWWESGYYCGAHGLNEGGDVVFDLAAGEPMSAPYEGIDRELPEALRTTAGTQIHAALRECEGDDARTLTEVVGEDMALSGLHVGLAAGQPKLTWSFEAETYYACSSDYAAPGEATSGLLPAAAPLQLDGPLPAGVERALEEIGQAHTVGWARLALRGPDRDAALAAFGKASQTRWPPSTTSDRPLAAPEGEAQAQAKQKLAEGRRLTRDGEFAAAVAAYDAAIALDGKLARAWSERGYARLLAGDLEGAQADLEDALPLDEGASFRAAVQFNLGQVAEKRGDKAAAKTAYEASLALREHEGVQKALARVQ